MCELFWIKTKRLIKILVFLQDTCNQISFCLKISKQFTGKKNKLLHVDLRIRKISRMVILASQNKLIPSPWKREKDAAQIAHLNKALSWKRIEYQRKDRSRRYAIRGQGSTEKTLEITIPFAVNKFDILTGRSVTLFTTEITKQIYMTRKGFSNKNKVPTQSFNLFTENIYFECNDKAKRFK